MARKAGVNAEQTRDQLLEAAAEVFTSSGYEGAKVSEIARRAGLTTGAIYAHYASKAELLCEAISMRVSTELAAVLAGENAGDLVGMLHALGVALPFRQDGPLLVEAVVAARRDAGVAEHLANGVAQREALLSAAIQRAQRDGSVDPHLPAQEVSRLCTTLAMGSLVVRALQLTEPDPKRWDLVIERLVGSLQARSQGSEAEKRETEDAR